jgi:hypothetical protein
MSGTQGNVTAAGDNGRRSVRLKSSRSFRYDVEVVPFDSPDNGREILSRNVRIPEGERRHSRQRGDHENLCPCGQTFSRDR